MKDKCIAAAMAYLREQNAPPDLIFGLISVLLGVQPDVPEAVPSTVTADETRSAAALRQARYRERLASQNRNHRNESVTERNSDVTPLSLNDTPTLTSTVENNLNPNPPKRTPKGVPKRPPAVCLADVLSPELAEAVVEHRRKLRKPLTEFAAERLAAQFAKAPDPNEAAAAMIERGWQGFNPDWIESASRDPPRAANGLPNRWDEFFAKAQAK